MKETCMKERNKKTNIYIYIQIDIQIYLYIEIYIYIHQYIDISKLFIYVIDVSRHFIQQVNRKHSCASVSWKILNFCMQTSGET